MAGSCNCNCGQSSVSDKTKLEGSYIIELRSDCAYEIQNRSAGFYKIEMEKQGSDCSFNIELQSNDKNQRCNEFYETDWRAAYMTVQQSDGSYEIVQIRRDDRKKSHADGSGEAESRLYCLTLKHADGSGQRLKAQRDDDKQGYKDVSSKTECRAVGHINLIPSDGSAGIEWPFEVLFNIKYRKPLQQCLHVFKRAFSSFLSSFGDQKRLDSKKLC